ncbi:hypothetical protein AAFN90_05410 [Erwiniaceae bacterium CAU 1747]
MKNILFMIFMFFPLIGNANDEFSGTWGGEVGTDGGIPDTSFSLWFHQDGKKLTGGYCFVTQRGNRTDCGVDNEISIRGAVINNHLAKVRVNPYFGGSGGIAIVSIHDNELYWKLEAPLRNERFYIPDEYKLKKQLETIPADIVSREMITKDFTVDIINRCGDIYSACDHASYRGIRKSNNNIIHLNGISIFESKINGGKELVYVFSNSNVSYHVYIERSLLTVEQDGKVILSQKGFWKEK